MSGIVRVKSIHVVVKVAKLELSLLTSLPYQCWVRRNDTDVAASYCLAYSPIGENRSTERVELGVCASHQVILPMNGGVKGMLLSM
jgi:hypothetical protein